MYRKNIKFIIFTFCTIILLISFFRDVTVKASSADITISAEHSKVTVGDTFTVSIDIEAEVLPGDFEAYITYPSEKLEFVPGTGIVAGGEGIIKISDHVTAAYSNHRKYIADFKAVSMGEAVISFREGPELYELEEGYLMSVSTNELAISISASKNASSDSSLAVLKVSPGSLEPAFLPDIKEYTVTVPFETEKLTVSAAATDRNATVLVFGNDSLKEENNRIEIRITAENGEESVYLINCKKEELKEPAKEDVKPSVTEAENPGTDIRQEEKEYVIKPEQEGTKALTDSIEALELMESYEKSLSTMTLIIALLSALCMALLIIVIRLATRKNNDELDD